MDQKKVKEFLEDISIRCHERTTTFSKDNSHETAFLEGQRSILLFIKAMLNPNNKIGNKMENQTTAPEVQSEQTENVVQNNTEATPQQTVLTETEQPKEVNFKDLIPENFREEKSLENFNNMETL